MRRRLRTTACMVFLLAHGGWAHAAGTKPAATAAFAAAKVHFEQNATDGDVEVVFDVKGGDEGLAELLIVAPDGRTVVDFKAPDSSTLGIRQFHFESPEPADVASLKAAYPEGVYKFSGRTSAGAMLVGKAALSHRLPATTAFIHPRPAAQGVTMKGLKISWNVVGGVVSYIVKIEQDDLNVKIMARLPGNSTAFAVPDGYLVPGTHYELGLGTVTRDGNISFVETTFSTGKD